MSAGPDEQAAIAVAEQRAADAEARTAKVEVGRMRLEVANEMGLDPAFAQRLKGSTKAELREDAKTLGTVVETLRPAEVPEPGDMNARIRSAAGRGAGRDSRRATPNADVNAAIRRAAGR